ncbi:hypothetical protein ACFL6I_18180 [candidate division KSB1 bacterium]
MRSISLSFLKYIAIILSALVILNVVMHMLRWGWGDWQEVLWYCNSAALIVALGIFFKNRALVGAVLITTISTQFLWVLDFFAHFLGFGFGRTKWVLEGSTPTIFLISVILHGILIPITLYTVHVLGFSKKSLLYAFIIFGVFLLPFTFLVADYQENINCVFYPCNLLYLENAEFIDSHSIYNSITYLIQNLAFWFLVIVVNYYIFSYIVRRTRFSYFVE